MNVRSLAVVILAFAILAGCASGPMKDIARVFEPKGEPQLQAGIKLYEDGRHAQAQKNFESALNGGLRDASKVSAHKYLAFIHCASKRERQCRGHFASALEIDPAFELDAAEAGHPMWGPVFRSVRGRR